MLKLNKRKKFVIWIFILRKIKKIRNIEFYITKKLKNS